MGTNAGKIVKWTNAAGEEKRGLVKNIDKPITHADGSEMAFVYELDGRHQFKIHQGQPIRLIVAIARLKVIGFYD